VRACVRVCVCVDGEDALSRRTRVLERREDGEEAEDN
jgi:hypothetical protein